MNVIAWNVAKETAFNLIVPSFAEWYQIMFDVYFILS